MTDHHSTSNLIPTVNIHPPPAVHTWHPAQNADQDGEQTQLARYQPLADAALDRRQFMKLMLASMGAAGMGNLAGCAREPAADIVPYVIGPETVVPGRPTYYSSVFTRNGYGYGVIAESHQGRPTKIEGNPLHPASLGASDVFMQAEVLNLYDPDRSRTIEADGQIVSQGKLEYALAHKRAEWSATGGEGLRILTPLITSPTLGAQLLSLLRIYPQARWHQWQPINDDSALQGACLAFGRDLVPQYHVQEADLVLQLDGDLLTELPGSLHYARDFARRREPLGRMSQVYAIESRPGLIGAMADYRLAANSALIEQMARYLAAPVAGEKATATCAVALNEDQRHWLKACAQELRNHKGRSLVIPGINQSPAVHALVHWLNDYLDNTGVTLEYHEPVPERSELLIDSLQALNEAMAAGEVTSLLLLDGNPVFNAPSDFAFAEHLRQVDFSVHLGLYYDETAALAQWHIPLSHMLESWSDARAYNGTLAIQQPLIRPLYATASTHSLLAFINDGFWRSDYDCVRHYWRDQFSHKTFEHAWREMLVKGVLRNSAAASVEPQLRNALWTELEFQPFSEELILQFAPDPRLWDGRYANNAWLQELPQPLTTLTWGNALLMSPALAIRLQVEAGDVVEVTCDDNHLEIPALVMPGHAENAVTINLGYGRNVAAEQSSYAISHGIGVNAYPLRTSDNLSLCWNVQLRKTGEHITLAQTQHHDSMEDRPLVRHATLEHFKQHPRFIAENESAHDPTISLYPEPTPEPVDTEGYEWGMSIDLNACIGCGACTIACQSENNIPVVGRDQVLKGREMHWLRIDRYYSVERETQNTLRTYFQPMLCQHCENAPCEYVCPVGATVHDSEGLNVMVYNRCIGTRDCAQNCPYKVRRFNFLDYNYHSPRSKAIAPVRNPDVTVRSRGVMEKCTYCLQRISEARIQAKKDQRPIQDGEVLTACQQACPTEAITFGDISDADTKVSQAKQHPLSYSVLAPLNTRPRTSYIARIYNLRSREARSESGGET